MSPLVSVVVPSYNHEKFLKERIDSILNQTFQDFELIILDDLSPDNSREIIETYRAHPKVSKIVYNEKNSGSTFFQWNKAIFELAQGEFIWIAESDDVAESNFLETLVPILKNDPEIVLAYCQSARMDSDGNITGSWKDWTDGFKNSGMFENEFVMDGRDYIYDFLLKKNTIPNASAVIFRRESYISVNGALTDLRTNGDWDLWFKLAMTGKIYFNSNLLNNFRYHNNSVIAQATKNKINIFRKKNTLAKYSIELRNSFNSSLKKSKLNVYNLLKLNNKYRRIDLIIFYFSNIIIYLIRR